MFDVMIVNRLLFNINKRSQTNLKHAKFEFYAQICYTIRINQFLSLEIKKNRSNIQFHVEYFILNWLHLEN